MIIMALGWRTEGGFGIYGDAVKHPAMNRKVSCNKELSSPKCQLYQGRETLVCTREFCKLVDSVYSLEISVCVCKNFPIIFSELSSENIIF